MALNFQVCCVLPACGPFNSNLCPLGSALGVPPRCPLPPPPHPSPCPLLSLAGFFPRPSARLSVESKLSPQRRFSSSRPNMQVDISAWVFHCHSPSYIPRMLTICSFLTRRTPNSPGQRSKLLERLFLLWPGGGAFPATVSLICTLVRTAPSWAISPRGSQAAPPSGDPSHPSWVMAALMLTVPPLSVHFSSVTQLCPTLCDPVNSRPPCPSTNSWGLPKPMPIELVMPSNHLILCRPLLLPPSIFPSIRVFSNESVLRIRWPEYWSFSFNISPSNEYLELIYFRMGWFDLLAVQGTLKSLIQHYSSEASILWRSAFFIVQISHPSMTTGKTRPLLAK